MSTVLSPPEIDQSPPSGFTHLAVLPDHTTLPDSDGAIVNNFQEHPQSVLLTESVKPVLRELRPDGHYVIGQDTGIYWKIDLEHPLRGCKSPDWFVVLGVPPMLKGVARRSYVIWQEKVTPVIALEFVSGDGSEERDRTPETGKFWVYEQAIRIPFYGIYEVKKASVEMYRLEGDVYRLMSPNERGHFPIPELGLELGIWRGVYDNMDLPWMRWWDADGHLLPSGDERATTALRERETAFRERETAVREKKAAVQEKKAALERAERLAERLRALGEDPDQV